MRNLSNDYAESLDEKNNIGYIKEILQISNYKNNSSKRQTVQTNYGNKNRAALSPVTS